MVLIIALVVFLLVRLLINHTAFGRNMYGLGGNREALFLGGRESGARGDGGLYRRGRSGGHRRRAVWRRAPLPDIPITASSGSSTPSLRRSSAGNSFSEGNGNILKTVLGVLFIQILKTGLNISGVSPQSQSFLLGLIVVAAISIDVLLKTRKEA